MTDYDANSFLISRVVPMEDSDTTMKNKKIKEVKDTTITNDLDQAEERFFNEIENMEKSLLHSAETLIHDEVDVLFGINHGAALHKSESSAKTKAVKDVNMKRGGSKVVVDEGNKFNYSHFLHATTDFMLE